MSIKLVDKFLNGFIDKKEVEYMQPYADSAYNLLLTGKAKSGDRLTLVLRDGTLTFLPFGEEFVLGEEKKEAILQD